MKLYKTIYEGGGERRICWQGTQADAAAKRKALKQEGCSDVKTNDEDVPTSKTELLEWLNTNVTGE